MKNFPVQIDNKEYWISRSVATVGFLFTENNGFKILAVKRGKGCPDEVGKWCCPCGYLEWNETLAEGCCREIKEETNLTVTPRMLHFWNINDDPTEAHQNITVRFVSFAILFSEQEVNTNNSEPDEVDAIKWIDFNELGNYDWAFGHLKLILDCIAEHYSAYFKSLSERTRLYLASLRNEYKN